MNKEKCKSRNTLRNILLSSALETDLIGFILIPFIFSSLLDDISSNLKWIKLYRTYCHKH